MIPDFELDNSEVTMSLFDQYEPQVRHIICDVYLKLDSQSLEIAMKWLFLIKSWSTPIICIRPLITHSQK